MNQVSFYLKIKSMLTVIYTQNLCMDVCIKRGTELESDLMKEYSIRSTKFNDLQSDGKRKEIKENQKNHTIMTKTVKIHTKFISSTHSCLLFPEWHDFGIPTDTYTSTPRLYNQLCFRIYHSPLFQFSILHSPFSVPPFSVCTDKLLIHISSETQFM